MSARTRAVFIVPHSTSIACSKRLSSTKNNAPWPPQDLSASTFCNTLDLSAYSLGREVFVGKLHSLSLENFDVFFVVILPVEVWV